LNLNLTPVSFETLQAFGILDSTQMLNFAGSSIIFSVSTMIIHIPFHFQLIQSYPLPVAHQKLCQMIYQLALHNDERACIAGSHALQQVMKEMGRATFRSNDVDVFTTLYFAAEDMKILERKFEEQCRDYFFCVDKIMESRSRVDGMRQIWNLVVMQIQRISNIAEVQTVDPPIQIIVLDNELPHDL
jgi:hypothetical protein